jgi:hypothetical protein
MEEEPDETETVTVFFDVSLDVIVVVDERESGEE